MKEVDYMNCKYNLFSEIQLCIKLLKWTYTIITDDLLHLYKGVTISEK